MQTHRYRIPYASYSSSVKASLWCQQPSNINNLRRSLWYMVVYGGGGVWWWWCRWWCIVVVVVVYCGGAAWHGVWWWYLVKVYGGGSCNELERELDLKTEFYWLIILQ